MSEATVDEDSLRLRAQFDLDPGRRELRVRYRLHNGRAEAWVAFDRGDTLAVAQGRLTLGMVGDPAMEQGADGLSLHQRAMPLRRPAPTVPPIPLGARVAPAADLDGEFRADIGQATRVRWCLGVAAFEPTSFSSPRTVAGVEVWRASFDVVPRQRELCTPWFDAATRRFEPEGRETSEEVVVPAKAGTR